MADAPATEAGIQGVKEQLQKNNADSAKKTETESEKVLGKLDQGTLDLIDNADGIQKKNNLLWGGIKTSVGLTAGFLKFSTGITALQWAMTKRDKKGERTFRWGKSMQKMVTAPFAKGLRTLQDFLTGLAKLGLFLVAGGILELFTNEKWQKWFVELWDELMTKANTQN